MKSIFSIFLAFSFFSATAQSLIYSENFNTGNGSFQLNTSDVTSTVSGYNQWLVNSTYSGGVFTEACLGFDVTIPSTANQPGSIAGSPNSGYLHISSIDALNSNVGCASFQASDGSLLCNGDEAYFAKMNQDISTLGNTGVTFSFYWLCSGSVSNYGEVYYSLNGGNTWNLQSGSYYNNPNWTLATLTNAAWDNQSQLRFGFRFVNQQSFSAADPPFAVDEIKLTVPGNNGNVDAQITGVSGLSFCPGTTFDVNYSAAGTFNAPNNFSIELSDALGNFTSPQTIGSVSSTISGLITCTIPVGIAAGTNYRMRIKASNPNFTSNDFGVNFTILEAPPADFISSPTGTNLEYSFGCSVFAFVDWQWNFGDGSTGTGAAINHTFPSSGVYQVCLEATAPNGCVSTICKPVIVVATGIIENKNAMILFPNPAKSTIQLNWIETRDFIEIYNSNGMLVRFIPIYSNFYELDISELNSGLYFIIDNKGVANKLIKE